MQVIVNDLMQQNYIYERTEAEGQNFSESFQPELTPILIGSEYSRQALTTSRILSLPPMLPGLMRILSTKGATATAIL